MINSANSLEFLKSKLLTMDKYSSTTNTKLLPTSAYDSLQEKFLLGNEIKDHDRVRVQHLENHSKLQNNKCCNNTFRNFYDNTSASSNVRDKEVFQMHQIKDDIELDVVNVEPLNSTTKMPLNIQSESAFNIDFNNKYHINNRIAENNNVIDNVKINASIVNETKNNLKFYCKEYNCYGLISKKSETTKMFVKAGETQINATESDSQRTEDQDNAYRHIESVHNYAKSKSFEGDEYDKVSPNDSRHSSFLSDDEEEDDEDNIADYDNDGTIDYEDRLPDDLDADYEDIFNKRKYRSFRKSSAPIEAASLNNNKVILDNRGANMMKYHKMQQLKYNKVEEDHVDVDVETVEPQLSSISPAMNTNSLLANNCIHDESTAFVKPDHHARRPMNAFLIFCKRHRAIVKDRYKNLENRAITKILGDWWASLEANEKTCFTNLAQQNKDAFFTANPNFKWYKLPAPPLRTLTTRPANIFGQEFQEDNSSNGHDMISSNNASHNHNSSNYFKLADEAHMGDLSQLMQDKSKTLKQCADLQQALGETSQFMSTHITCNSETLDENRSKRRFYSENSYSSNSSEEDTTEPKKKRGARTCKGKRYQELINSGQIATALKKPKSLVRPIGADTVANTETNMKLNCANVYSLSNLNNNNNCLKRSLSESENTLSYDINSFDLEEKIKLLPALNLDDYLQRKRNTKKKKKFASNGKKRGQRSANNKTNQTSTDLPEEHQQQINKCNQQQQQQQSTAAVGSQKRKARKESITRRDVSAIEQEVTSLLPLTINGCCYFQDAPTAIEIKETYEEDIKPFNIASQSPFLTPTSPIIPTQDNSSAPTGTYIKEIYTEDINISNITSQTPFLTPTSPIIPTQEKSFASSAAIETKEIYEEDTRPFNTIASQSPFINSSSPVSIYIFNNTNMCNNNISNDNISPSTSDLLILAEVAANRTELEN